MALLVIRIADSELLVNLGEEGCSVGPDMDADVVLKDARRHEIRPTPRGWVVMPAEDGGPVSLNGRALLYPTLLADGDRIEAGPAMIQFYARQVLVRDKAQDDDDGGQGLTACNTQDGVRRLLDTALSVTGGYRGFLLVRRQRGLTLAASRGFGSDTDSGELQVSYTIAKRVFQTLRPIHTADARLDHRFLEADSVQAHGIGSVICAPLTIDSESLGVLYLDRPADVGPFPRDCLAIIESLAAAASHTLAREEEYRLLAAPRTEGGVRPARACPGWKVADRLFVGRSPAALSLIEMIQRVARSDAPVVIWGESGTGKELVARMIHEASLRGEGSFQAVGCSSLANELLDAELFGYAKGAFTGAYEERPGLFARSDGGTVLLDDVSEMHTQLQNRLLRVLDDGAVRPLGSEQTVPVDFRLLSTTRANLEERVSAGALRRDLYYRLATFVIRVPALRERVDDIPLLAEHFLREHEGPGMRRFIQPAAMELLKAYRWPGNVRELRNELLRAAMAAGRHDIGPEHLSARVRGEADEPGCREAAVAAVRPLEEIEREAVVAALKAFRGNRAKTARALGMARSTLYKRMEQFNLA